ncbi:fungal-specific transcription factor domain-domain-containing protein [Clohesyomyces aquaticus]|uniref:Fungal-specific transcription factor domain-domain-containing protein n=1 Tax=Clohesyomyces aquaticus TaxID=1231657 RepID=A0A1Y2A8T7_9PLEO|nr:fungal-specific transcription factor domain-domain-containing protein [Clohesyomyces aquaticus]
MAETITIPSPSLFLNSQPSSPAHSPGKQSPCSRRPSKPAPKETSKTSDGNPITKRKQSKSRNGCITCKAKRLKCDETKPSCQQCARRGVVCGGYKKDFKWRPFEEASFTGKPSPAKSKKSWPNSFNSPISPVQTVPTTFSPTSAPPPLLPVSPAGSDDSHRTIVNPTTLHNAFFPHSSAHGTMPHRLPPTSAFVDAPYPPLGDLYALPQVSPYMVPRSAATPQDYFEPGSVESSNSMFDVDSVDTRPTKTTAPSSISSGQSPRLLDLLLPGTDLTALPEEYMSFRSQYPESFYQPSVYNPAAEAMEEDDVEEIPRPSFNPDHEAWIMRLPSPTPSSSSSSSSDSHRFPLLTQPQFAMDSAEMLTLRFDRETCGILSIKDGPTENPWRTLVWPLARDCPALFHAIASMTSFHQSRDSPPMRIQGIDHMRTSVHALASSLENMRVDAAISTTLVLAFSESWDQHISTGINHIKGAKLLIDRALNQHNRTPLRGEEFNRLKFLCNSWIYMDVIARLTSADEDESNDFDIVSDAIYMNGQADAEIDPLMGCASTLFPIIGRVANLVRKVRRTQSNGPSVISQAIHLKSQLEDWVPPAFIEDPEDATTSPHDSIKTATAYQYATLLYLHQAVPEIPSPPSALLAKRALCEIATVEPRSRSVIVHIYPLMAAGCEVMDQEDREWVQNRWNQMGQRMKLGIIEKCLEVTKEVWSRRDAYAAEKETQGRSRNTSTSSASSSLKREFSAISEELDMEDPFAWPGASNKRRAVVGSTSFDSPRPITIKTERSEGKRRSEAGTELLEPELTVKGRLHWLGVMKDWNWEVLLG